MAANSESVSGSNSDVLSATPTWIVDPIDGTTNFLHSFPFSCVSIGLVVDKIPTVGVVYNPFTKELFQALTELGYDRSAHKLQVMFACMDVLIRRGVHSVRMMGSACMALSYLACGRLDALYTGVNGDGWKPWDYAAGVCIVTEAGGTLRTITGEPFDVLVGSLVASCSDSLGSELVEALREHIDLNC
eukprot:gene22936-29115_t